MDNYNNIAQKINTRNRKLKEIEIDEATANDTIRDADLSSAEIIYPQNKKKNKNQKNEF